MALIPVSTTELTNTKCLTPARTRLIQLMHDVGYGRIVGLHVREGDPVFDPAPVVKRFRQFGKSEVGRDADGRQGLELKSKMREMLELFDRERTLDIDELKFEDGQPVLLIITATISA